MTYLRLLNSATVKDDIHKQTFKRICRVEGCHNIHINRQLWRISLCTNQGKQGSRYSQKIQKKFHSEVENLRHKVSKDGVIMLEDYIKNV